METLKVFARRDLATDSNGELNIAAVEDHATVTLEFQAQPNTQLEFEPHLGEAPALHQTVNVDGVERYFWVEYAGKLGPRRDMRNVGGYDLRHSRLRVITTDDGRRFVILADALLPRYVIDEVPAGPRRVRITQGAAILPKLELNRISA